MERLDRLIKEKELEADGVAMVERKRERRSFSQEPLKDTKRQRSLEDRRVSGPQQPKKESTRRCKDDAQKENVRGNTPKPVTLKEYRWLVKDEWKVYEEEIAQVEKDMGQVGGKMTAGVNPRTCGQLRAPVLTLRSEELRNMLKRIGRVPPKTYEGSKQTLVDWYLNDIIKMDLHKKNEEEAPPSPEVLHPKIEDKVDSDEDERRGKVTPRSAVSDSPGRGRRV